MTTAIASIPALTLVLPVPPFLNDAYKCWRNRVVLTQAGKDYKKTVWALAQRQLRHLKPFPLFGKGAECKLYIAWHRATRRGDTDGILKLLLDSLQGTVYHKDSQVAALFVWRVEGAAPASLVTAVNRVDRTRTTEYFGAHVDVRVESWSPTQAPVF